MYTNVSSPPLPLRDDTYNQPFEDTRIRLTEDIKNSRIVPGSKRSLENNEEATGGYDADTVPTAPTESTDEYLITANRPTGMLVQDQYLTVSTMISLQESNL